MDAAAVIGVIAIFVTLGLAILGLAVGYGGALARIRTLESRADAHDAHDKRHDSYIAELRAKTAEGEGYRKAYESIHEE